MNDPASSNSPLLRVGNLRVDFGAHSAVSDVTFDLFGGETLGLVGESGSGKSTLARAILRLVGTAHGTVLWRGEDLLSCPAKALRTRRRDLQMIFQDPLASLNPRMTVGEAIAEPLRIFAPGLDAGARQTRVGQMLERVGLTTAMARRYPHEFSGGQCQRVGIARAMILEPKLLICDEPVSSLDVSIQGQIVNLLLDLQRDAGTAMLFISHNLAVVRHVSHRILVMYSGRIVEVASREALFAAPLHPYTRELLAAVPSLRPVQRAAAVEQNAAVPRDAAAPQAAAAPHAAAAPQAAAAPRARIEEPSAPLSATGCAFRERCAYALPLCAAAAPPLAEQVPGHWSACHRARELLV